MTNTISQESNAVDMSSEAEVMLSELNEAATLSEVIIKVNELCKYVKSIKTRDRGPKSSRVMTNDDAFNVKFGTLSQLTNKAAAVKLGLSYGQVYSARLNYTFKQITKDYVK